MSPTEQLSKPSVSVRKQSASTAELSLAEHHSEPAADKFQFGSDFARYLELPFIHIRMILACVLLSMLVGWLALLVWPRSYESEAQLVIRVGRESVSLDPTATTSQTLMLQKTQEEEINSALALLGSRQVAEQVVARIGPGPILDGYLPAKTPSESSAWDGFVDGAKETVSDAAFNVLLWVGLKDDIGDHELAVRRVQSLVSISAPKKSNVITVHAESKSPEMAQAMASTATEVFLQQHLEVSATKGSQGFFVQQSKNAQQQLNELVADKSRFMQERNIVTISSNQSILRDQLGNIDRDVLVARGELQQSLAEIEDLRGKLDETVDEIVSSKSQASDVTWSGMRQRVYELELQEKRYAALYTEDNKLLQQTREELDGARQILAKLQSDRVDSSTTPNPLKRRMEEDLQKLQTKVVGLKSKISEKESQRAETERQINQLLEDERQLTEMDREIEIHASNLALMREKLEEARVIDELQQDQISNISVFQPATFVERAVSPKKRILAAAFVVFGLMAGTALGLIRQATETCFRHATDVESQLPCSVIAEIPLVADLPGQGLFESNVLREQARRVLTDLLLAGAERDRQSALTVGVLSSEAGCGGSTIAASLAVAARNAGGLQTILVDADAKQRTVSTIFGNASAPGLVELLQGDAAPSECLQSSRKENIELVAYSGTNLPVRMQWDGQEVAAALNSYSHSCDLLVVDLPPADQPNQIIGLAQNLDLVLIVLQSERSQTADVERLIRRLQTGGAQIAGVVLNQSRSYIPKLIRRCIGG